MTSMPASRKARATTFAPRSWPSRPGFAIRTRSGSDNQRLLEHAELGAQHVHHLAERAVRERALDEVRHQVLGALRRGAQAGQRAVDPPGVALGADPPQPLHLAST